MERLKKSEQIKTCEVSSKNMRAVLETAWRKKTTKMRYLSLEDKNGLRIFNPDPIRARRENKTHP